MQGCETSHWFPFVLWYTVPLMWESPIAHDIQFFGNAKSLVGLVSKAPNGWIEGMVWVWWILGCTLLAGAFQFVGNNHIMHYTQVICGIRMDSVGYPLYMATPLIHPRYVKAPISLPQVDLERANAQGNPEHRPGGHFNCRHENLIVIDNCHIIPLISKNMGIKWDNNGY